jgi:hypothetical protein
MRLGAQIRTNFWGPMAFVEADIEKLCFVGEGLTRSERKHLETGAVGKVQGYKRECTEDSTCIYTHNNFILQKGG